MICKNILQMQSIMLGKLNSVDWIINAAYNAWEYNALNYVTKFMLANSRRSQTGLISWIWNSV